MSNTAATGSMLVILKKKWEFLHYLNAGTVTSVITHQAVIQSALCYTVGFLTGSGQHHRRGF